MPDSQLDLMSDALPDWTPDSLRVLPRRTVIAASGTAVLAACVACGSSAGSAAPSSSSAATGSAGAKTLAAVADVPDSTGLVVSGANGQVLLAKKDGKVVAHSAVCTHQGGIVAADGVCPLHGSKFDITTGDVLSGPASQPLPAVAVTETDGNVVTA